MVSTHKVGDVFIDVEDSEAGFVLLKEVVISFPTNKSAGRSGFTIKWFDDGLTGAFSNKTLDEYLADGSLIKASDGEGFKIKLKYSENLTRQYKHDFKSR